AHRRRAERRRALPRHGGVLPFAAVNPLRRTRIVATIGPATETEERLRQLLEAGMDVARLNFSHGSLEWHRERFALLRRLAEERGAALAILQDLSGPKVRVGAIP